MIETTWTISQLDRSLPDGVVLTAHWRCTGADGEFTGSVYGVQSFPAKDPADPAFVPYDQITEEQALGWTKAALGAETVAAHEAAVQGQIDALKNPTSATGVPW